MKVTPAQNTKVALENLISALEAMLVPQLPPPTPLAKTAQGPGQTAQPGSRVLTKS